MNRFAAISLALLAMMDACATERAVGPQGDVQSLRRDLCCMENVPSESDAEAKCTARFTREKNCSYGPELRCSGMAPDREKLEEKRKTCQVHCACTCETERRECIKAD
jgi:hypothetical protein